MAEFKKRETAPSASNKYYLSTTAGGYNKCLVITSKGECIPNCVGYAWGRYMEEQGLTSCKLSRSNAENWWDTKDGYKRGQTPKIGAVVCWRKGQAHYSKDGAGHVAIVEEVKSNGDILVSESGYNSFRFRTHVYTKSSGYSAGKNYFLQGFIYPDTDFNGGDKPTPEPTPEPTPSGLPTTYKVVKGDNLTKICKKFYGKYTTELGNKVVNANKKKYPKMTLNYIQVGWTLTIPA